MRVAFRITNIQCIDKYPVGLYYRVGPTDLFVVRLPGPEADCTDNGIGTVARLEPHGNEN